VIASLTEHDRVDLDVLGALYAAPSPLTPYQLARHVCHGESAVHASLQRLRTAGCVFDEHPQQGVRLVEAGLGVWRMQLSHALNLPEQAIHVYRRTSSTQDRAKENLRQREVAGLQVVIADEQAAGRGRLGRRWYAPRGSSVLMTVTLPLAAQRTRGVEPITAYTAVALLEAIESVVGIAPTLKWPNDAVVDGRKIAGILVERFEGPHGSFAILGIGVNVNRPDSSTADPALLSMPVMPREVAERVAWLSDAAGRRIDRLPLLTEIVRRVLHWTRQPDRDAALHRWRRSCTTLGQHRRFLSDGREVAGDVLDVDLDEGLIVRRDTGELLHLPAASTTVL
jgi:BirA family transcriptional regulator, biotin operon repressor / biotin---[acetyl-CoA-carboxylase] ligase